MFKELGGLSESPYDGTAKRIRPINEIHRANLDHLGFDTSTPYYLPETLVTSPKVEVLGLDITPISDGIDDRWERTVDEFGELVRQRISTQRLKDMGLFQRWTTDLQILWASYSIPGEFQTISFAGNGKQHLFRFITLYSKLIQFGNGEMLNYDTPDDAAEAFRVQFDDAIAELFDD